MRSFLDNLLLALAWAALMEDFTAPSLLVGFCLGLALLALAGRTSYPRRLVLALRFVAWYALDLVLSSLRVAGQTLSPLERLRPMVLAVPLEARSETEIALLASLITLTPGTLAVEIAEDHSHIRVHTLTADDPERVRRQIRTELEQRVLELLR